MTAKQLFQESLPASSDDPFPKLKGPLTEHRKTEARLAALQALYQAKLLEREWDDILKEWQTELKPRKIHSPTFELITSALSKHAERYQEIVSHHLLESWTWDRLPLITQCLLTTATAELEVNVNVDTPVVLNEFMILANGYLSDEEAGFVNACLQKIAGQVRPAA